LGLLLNFRFPWCSKDLNTVKKLVEDCVSGQLTSSLRPLDAVAALDPMSEVHINNHLPTVEHCDSKLSSLVQHMNKCKVAMTRCVHTQLQSVAALQRRIRDMRNQLVGYREAMQRQVGSAETRSSGLWED
jgi:autophagy-related protein 11